MQKTKIEKIITDKDNRKITRHMVEIEPFHCTTDLLYIHIVKNCDDLYTYELFSITNREALKKILF